MGDTKFTPGPWHFDKDEMGCKFIKGGKMGSSKQAQYQKLAFTTGLHSEERDTANAALIAAAPDMYAALKQLMKDGHGCRFCDSGKLRKPNDPNKGHDYDCGYLLAEAALSRATDNTVK